MTNQDDIATLTQLNADYLSSDQNSNIGRYNEILADDFTASLADYKLYDKAGFLAVIAAGRPFTDLKAYDVIIRLYGDFAIIHARVTFMTRDGVIHHGRYTDDWQRRNGQWLCIAANVIAENIPL